MDGSSSIVVKMPIMILIALFTGIALPLIAGSRSGRSHAGGAASTRRWAESDQRRQAEGSAAETGR
jgi:hypothetical protein